MFGRRRKSTKSSPFDSQALLGESGDLSAHLPDDRQVEEDVRAADPDDVAFTTRVPTVQEALAAEPVVIEDRFRARDKDDNDEEEDDEVSWSEEYITWTILYLYEKCIKIVEPGYLGQQDLFSLECLKNQT